MGVALGVEFTLVTMIGPDRLNPGEMAAYPVG